MGTIWSLLFGRTVTVNGSSYKVLRRLGEGGFSYVELVRGPGGRSYALKQLLLQVEDQRTSLENEIQAHRAVQHDNVLELIDSEMVERGNGEARGYLIFPFYRHGTLEDEITLTHGRNKIISEERILQLMLSVCQGLFAMHNASLAHRDIKPGNLLLSEDREELVLMDLGSAAKAEVTITNRQEGLALQEHCAQTCTAMYRAPELFEVPSECTITGKSDVWSLGCTIYAAAFGTSPCDGSALSAMSGRIVFPRNHSYSQDFCNLIVGILKVEPSERPSVDIVEEQISDMLGKFKQNRDHSVS